MLKKIKKAIEDCSLEPLNSNTAYMKLFCGLAYKHSIVSNKEVAAFLGISPSSVSYYRKEHNNMLAVTEYLHLYEKVEGKIL